VKISNKLKKLRIKDEFEDSILFFVDVFADKIDNFGRKYGDVK